MGNTTSAPDDYPLQPRRLDKVFDDVKGPRVPLGAVNSNANNANANAKRPGRAAKKQHQEHVEPLPPSYASVVPPTPEGPPDPSGEFASTLTPGATRSAMKDEVARRRALHVLRGEAVQTAVAETLAKTAASASTRGGDLNALKTLQKQVNAIAESSTVSLEKAAAELQEVHTRQLERVRRKRRVTIAEPPQQADPEEVEEAGARDQAAEGQAQGQGQEAPATGGEFEAVDAAVAATFTPNAADIVASLLRRPSLLAPPTAAATVEEEETRAATPEVAAAAAASPIMDHATASDATPAAAATPTTPGVGLAFGAAARAADLAPQPLPRPRSTPEPMTAAPNEQADASAASASSAASSATSDPSAANLDSPEAVMAYLAHRKAQLTEQRKKAALVRAQLSELEETQRRLRGSEAAEEAEKARSSAASSRGSRGSAAPPSRAPPWSLGLWSRVSVATTEAAFSSDAGSEAAEEAAAEQAAEQAEAETEEAPATALEVVLNSPPTWVTPEAAAAEEATVTTERGAPSSIEEVALVLSLRRKITALEEALEAERVCKERMLHSKVVCPHCEAIF